MAEEKIGCFAFDGENLKEILPVLKKHFHVSIVHIQGLLQWCEDTFYDEEAKKARQDGNNTDALDCRVKFFIDENKKVYVPFQESFCNKIQAFFSNEENLIKEDNQETILCLMFYIYSGAFLEPDPYELFRDDNYMFFYSSVRPDMLKLYKFLHASCPRFKRWRDDYKKHPTVKWTNFPSEASKEIIISYGKHQVKLENDDEWFLQHLTEYITKYLKENSIEEVNEELEGYKRPAGAKLEKDFNRIVLQLYHFLQDETPYHSPGGKITDKICVFITRFLEILGYLTIVPPEEEFDVPRDEAKKKKTLRNWIGYTRSRITDNLKREKEIGPYKDKLSETWDSPSFQAVEHDSNANPLAGWHKVYW